MNDGRLLLCFVTRAKIETAKQKANMIFVVENQRLNNTFDNLKVHSSKFIISRRVIHGASIHDSCNMAVRKNRLLAPYSNH